MSTSSSSPAVHAFRELMGDVDYLDDSTLAKAIYSSDASIYRIVPQMVARPRTREELITVVQAALDAGLPVTGRGAGTSCAGNAVGPGLIVDTTGLNRVLSIDPETGIAVVEPGVIQSDLQAAAAPHGWRYGPDPSTSNRCTIGGMIGNNACGPRALGYGRSADSVVEMEVITGTGEVMTLVKGMSGGMFNDLRALVSENLATIRTEFGTFSRQVSGYSMEHLLPENGFDLPAFMAGTEGTLGLITQVSVQLVRDAPYKTTIALGYPTMADGADDMPTLLPFSPTACEGMDRRLARIVEENLGADAVPDLPEGDGWLFLEVVGDDPDEVTERAHALVRASHATQGWVVDDPEQAARLWGIRSDAAGLASVALEKPAYAGWEDSAVPPAKLGAYLRDLEDTLSDFGLHGLPYGHFGDGCVHCRIDFPLGEEGGTGILHDFMVAAGKLAASYGGSMSGEHGDGRARSELLPLMYSEEAIQLFADVKALFDPQDLLNPGVVVRPDPMADRVRTALARTSPLTLRDPDFAAAVHRCTGVGKCRANTTRAGSVMCPSYQATGRDQDSTRGRSRVLQEMVNGTMVKGWRSPEVAEALELCLSCKGCRRDCPTGVDMAAMKSRVLNEKYRHRLRPASHYSMGWLPMWGRLVTTLKIGWLANIATQTPGLSSVVKALAGVDDRRPMPAFTKGRSASAQAADMLARECSGACSTPDSAPSSTSGSQDGGRGGSPVQAALIFPRTTYRIAARLLRAAVTRGKKSAGANPTHSAQAHQTSTSESWSPRGPVAIWVDSFSDAFVGGQIPALVNLLVRVGYDPRIVSSADACCGLTWITTGQLNTARSRMRQALSALEPIAAQGIPIVGMEPSCLAVWRSDAHELLPDDERVPVVAEAMHTLAELLVSIDWQPPSLEGQTIIAQPHCHHRSVLGWAADEALLTATGASVRSLGGCCGLAGNFGVEKGHYEVSVAVAEHDLLPALREAPEDAIVLADGFSCRKQVADLTEHRARTLAEILLSFMD